MDPRIIVVGASLGGTPALERFVSSLVPRLNLPVVIVQHRRKDSDEIAVRTLAAHCVLPLTEAEDKETLRRDRVYIGPADYHLLIDVAPDSSPIFSLSTEAPIHRTRPSIDLLFESACDIFGDKVIGVLLAGTAPDGKAGMIRIKEAGGLTIVQRPTFAEEGTVSDAVRQVADKLLTADEIGPFLVKLTEPPPPWKGMAQVVIHTSS